MNRVEFTGTLEENPIVTINRNNESTITKIRIKVPRNGKYEDFPKITLYDEAAEVCANSLRKGDLVYVEGTYRTGKYGGYIVASRIERFLGNKKDPKLITEPDEKAGYNTISEI